MNSCSEGLKADIFGATDIGCVRENNEDTLICESVLEGEFVLLAAIDGMGGCDGGEVAADIARRTILMNVESASADDYPLNIINRAMVDANNQIVARRQVDVRYPDMGCVATAALLSLKTGRLYMGHCGDSRLYCYFNGELKKLSRDHSVVGYLEDTGAISEHEAMAHPRRNIITRCLGKSLQSLDGEDFLQLEEFDLPQSEGPTQYVICSDGLNDMLDYEQIGSVVSENLSAKEKVEKLIDFSKRAGGKDNITVIVAAISSVEAKDCPTEQSKADNQPEASSKKREKAGRRGLSPATSTILPWIFFIAVLGCISAAVIKHYLAASASPTPTPAPAAADTTTVIVPLANEHDSIKVDTVSRIVMQARDSARVDIPRRHALKSARKK